MGGRRFTLDEKKYIHHCFALFDGDHSTEFIVRLIKQSFPDDTLAYRNQWRSLKKSWGANVILEYGNVGASSSLLSSQSSQSYSSSSSCQVTVVDVKNFIRKSYDLDEVEECLKARKKEIEEEEKTEVFVWRIVATKL